MINTGQYELEKYMEYPRLTAERFGLGYEEIEGADTLVKKMNYSSWGDEFVVMPPGETFRLVHFNRLDEDPL